MAFQLSGFQSNGFQIPRAPPRAVSEGGSQWHIPQVTSSRSLKRRITKATAKAYLNNAIMIGRVSVHDVEKEQLKDDGIPMAVLMLAMMG